MVRSALQVLIILQVLFYPSLIVGLVNGKGIYTRFTIDFGGCHGGDGFIVGGVFLFVLVVAFVGGFVDKCMFCGGDVIGGQRFTRFLRLSKIGWLLFLVGVTLETVGLWCLAVLAVSLAQLSVIAVITSSTTAL